MKKIYDNLVTLGEGNYFRFVRDGKWEYIQPKKFSGVVMLVPITEDGKLVLIEQYRLPVDRKVIEIPAGLVGDTAEYKGESLEAAARRELVEETGYEASNVQFMFDGVPSPGSNSVVLSFFRMTGLKKVGDGGGDHTEDIDVMEIPVRDVPDFLVEQRKSGKMIDLKVYAGLEIAKNYIKSGR